MSMDVRLVPAGKNIELMIPTAPSVGKIELPQL